MRAFKPIKSAVDEKQRRGRARAVFLGPVMAALGFILTFASWSWLQAGEVMVQPRFGGAPFIAQRGGVHHIAFNLYVAGAGLMGIFLAVIGVRLSVAACFAGNVAQHTFLRALGDNAVLGAAAEEWRTVCRAALAAVVLVSLAFYLV